MKLYEIRDKIKKRYKVGQVVSMRERNQKDAIVRKYKVKILGFYPYHVGCLVDGYRESYTFHDFMVLTAHKKGESD